MHSSSLWIEKIAIILDLEGTLISNGQALAGSIKLLEYLMERDIPFRIITNTDQIHVKSYPLFLMI